MAIRSILAGLTALAASLPTLSQAQAQACYQQCMDEATKPQPWQLLETGAKCSGGEPMKHFERGHPAPPGRVWLRVTNVETFEGSRPAETAIIDHGKTLNVVSYCHNTLEAKHRIYALHGPENIDQDAAHRACVQKCP